MISLVLRILFLITFFSQNNTWSATVIVRRFLMLVIYSAFVDIMTIPRDAQVFEWTTRDTSYAAESSMENFSPSVVNHSSSLNPSNSRLSLKVGPVFARTSAEKAEVNNSKILRHSGMQTTEDQQPQPSTVRNSCVLPYCIPVGTIGT